MGQLTRSISTSIPGSNPNAGPTTFTPDQIIDEALRLLETQDPDSLNFDQADILNLLTALRSYREGVIVLKTNYDLAIEERQDSQKDAEALETNVRNLQATLAGMPQATPFATPLTPAAAPHRSAKHLDPPEFDGNRDELEGFKFKLQQKLLMNGN